MYKHEANVSFHYLNVYPAYCHQIMSTIIYWIVCCGQNQSQKRQILDSFFISAFPPFSCHILKTSISHSVLTGSIIIMLFGLLLLLFVGLDKLWSRIKGLTKETTKAIVAVVVWLYICLDTFCSSLHNGLLFLDLFRGKIVLEMHR